MASLENNTNRTLKVYCFKDVVRVRKAWKCFRVDFDFHLEEVATKSPSSSRSLQNKTPLTKGTAVSSSRVRWVWNLNFFFFTKKAIAGPLFFKGSQLNNKLRTKNKVNLSEMSLSRCRITWCFHGFFCGSSQMIRRRNLETNAVVRVNNAHQRGLITYSHTWDHSG